ncbi:Protein Niban [Bienertia sinuspersici]
MGKNVILCTILVLLIIATVSDAALLWNFRKLAASSPKEDRNSSGSPIPSPISPEKQSGSVGGEEKGKKKQNQPPPSSTPGDENSKDKITNNATIPSPPPTDAKEHSNKTMHKENVKEKEEEKKEDEKENENEKEEQKEEEKEKKEERAEEKEEEKEEQKEAEEKKADTPVGSDESCDGKGRCEDLKSMTACIKRFDHGAPASQGNFFQQFPSYSKFITPIYGAYLMLVITLIAGGVFACCCWFKKRKGQRDIPYQELEMSMPESAVAVESAEGWDEVWDDDWDEEIAVRSPGGHNISANGLTSRSSKKDDWEDWDD